MFQLVQHIWLWALTALAVPVIIHLWNTRQGKTLKVGSIAFFTETARSHARSFKLSELLLLALRCLLFTLLVMLLVKLLWIKQDDPGKHKGWFLVEKNSIKEAYKNFQPEIDSLLQAGYQFHYFNPGFRQDAFEAALAAKPDSASNAPVSCWRLLKELDRNLPESMPVHLFTDNALQGFRGNRADVNLNLTWRTYQSADTSATWLETAFETIDDSVCVVIGNSSANGTWYTHRTLSRLEPDPELTWIEEEGKTFINFAPVREPVKVQRVKVDTASLKVSIYNNGNQGDASYIRAAIEAIRDVTRKKITVNSIRHAAEIPARQDWLFWFSDEKIPTSLLKSKVLRYSKGRGAKLYSAIITGDDQGTSAGGLLASFLQLKQRASEKDAEVVWRNGFGDPLLIRVINEAEIYDLASRFNPQWNDMPWSNQFPQIIYDLLFNKQDSGRPVVHDDKRKIDAKQVFAVKANNEVFPKETRFDKTDLSTLLWLMAFTVFLIERIIVFTSKSKRANG